MMCNKFSSVHWLQRRVLAASALAATFLTATAVAEVAYDVRVRTGDTSHAISGKAKLGSFGSPSINDQGNVAFACAIYGPRIGSIQSYGVGFRRKGTENPKIAVQSGLPKGYYSQFVDTQSLYISDPRTISDSFLHYYRDPDRQPVLWSAYMFRISKEVAINNSNRIAFSGQLIQTVETATRNNMGNITKITPADDTYSTIGEAFPYGQTFSNGRVVTYLEYNADILTRTTSINQGGAVPYNGLFDISPVDQLPGFAFNVPFGSQTLVATTGSTATGLPYVTTFDSFTDAIIASGSRCFVVANLSNTGADFDGIWQGRNTNLQPVVVLNTKAPGGGTFSTFDGKVSPSPNAKYVTFIANLTGGKVDRGAFRSLLDGSSIQTVAGVGDKAPGTTSNFADFSVTGANNRGAVAILGTVQQDGKELTGVWLSDNDGKKLQLIVLEGNMITVGKKEKKITKIAFSPVSGINKKGQVAFTASFTDRTSAVIVAN